MKRVRPHIPYDTDLNSKSIIDVYLIKNKNNKIYTDHYLANLRNEIECQSMTILSYIIPSVPCINPYDELLKIQSHTDFDRGYSIMEDKMQHYQIQYAYAYTGSSPATFIYYSILQSIHNNINKAKEYNGDDLYQFYQKAINNDYSIFFDKYFYSLLKNELIPNDIDEYDYDTGYLYMYNRLIHPRRQTSYKNINIIHYSMCKIVFQYHYDICHPHVMYGQILSSILEEKYVIDNLKEIFKDGYLQVATLILYHM